MGGLEPPGQWGGGLFTSPPCTSLRRAGRTLADPRCRPEATEWRHAAHPRRHSQEAGGARLQVSAQQLVTAVICCHCLLVFVAQRFAPQAHFGVREPPGVAQSPGV